jgi:hypothetical protein
MSSFLAHLVQQVVPGRALLQPVASQAEGDAAAVVSGATTAEADDVVEATIAAPQRRGSMAREPRGETAEASEAVSGVAAAPIASIADSATAPGVVPRVEHLAPPVARSADRTRAQPEPAALTQPARQVSERLPLPKPDVQVKRSSAVAPESQSPLIRNDEPRAPSVAMTSAPVIRPAPLVSPMPSAANPRVAAPAPPRAQAERTPARTQRPVVAASITKAPAPAVVGTSLRDRSPSVVPRPPRLPALAEPASPSTSAPQSVRVTIGRVEVRAVAPQASPARTTKPAPAANRPTLSLADYLARRGKGN